MQEACRGVEPPRQAGAIGGHVGNRAPRDACVHGGLGDEGGNIPDQPGVEGCGDNIVRPKLQTHALIGSRHLVGHILAR